MDRLTGTSNSNDKGKHGKGKKPSAGAAEFVVELKEARIQLKARIPEIGEKLDELLRQDMAVDWSIVGKGFFPVCLGVSTKRAWKMA